jgi:heme-degrading monooxygenase HmoA
MSVLMTLRIKGDATKLERFVSESPGRLESTAERGKRHGLISHRFYGNDSEIIAVDEWPSEDAFHAFFAASPEIKGYFETAGVTSPPEVTFWHKLETHDDVG